MIQRLQTVFLFLCIVTLGIYLYLPAIQSTGAENFTQTLKGWEIRDRASTGMGVYFFYVNAILLGTAAGLSLLNIFLYKWRKVQIAVIWLTIPFILAAAGYTYYKWSSLPSLYINRKLLELDVYLTPFNLLLAVAVVFQLLAFIYIRKDQNLIKSLDRLR